MFLVLFSLKRCQRITYMHNRQKREKTGQFIYISGYWCKRFLFIRLFICLFIEPTSFSFLLHLVRDAPGGGDARQSHCPSIWIPYRVHSVTLPPPQSSSPLHRQTRPKTRRGSSRFSNIIPGALSFSPSLPPLPWLSHNKCPPNPSAVGDQSLFIPAV